MRILLPRSLSPRNGRDLYSSTFPELGGGLPKSAHINVVFHRNNDLSGEIDKVIDGNDAQM